jgi:hypothetical protein
MTHKPIRAPENTMRVGSMRVIADPVAESFLVFRNYFGPGGQIAGRPGESDDHVTPRNDLSRSSFDLGCVSYIFANQVAK